MDTEKAKQAIKIQNQIDEFEKLKDKLFCQIPCNNNVGYDFIAIKDLAAINAISNIIKNEKGKNLNTSIEFFQEQWEKMLNSFIVSFKKEMEEL